MSKTSPAVLDISSTFTVLQPDLRASPVELTPTIYADLDRDFDGFRGRWLMSQHSSDKPWSSWERHPAGDEIVYLLSGDVTVVLEVDGAEKEVRLSRAGSYAIVPRNTWHTARPHEKSEMLFITPGEGTENRPA